MLRKAAAIALAVQVIVNESDDDFTGESDELDDDIASGFDDVASESGEDITRDFSDDITNDSDDDISSDSDDDINAPTSPPYWNDDRIAAWLESSGIFTRRDAYR